MSNPEIERRIRQQIPPHSLEAERAVLACVLFSEEAFNLIVGTLKAEDFYDKRHALLYENFLELRRQNAPIDLVSVRNHLETKGEMEAVGGLDMLTRLTEVHPVIDNAEHYAEIVRDKRILRDIIDSMEEVVEHSYGDAAKIDEVIDLASKRLYEARGEGRNDGFTEIGKILAQRLNELELQSKEGRKDQIASGFPSLDKTLGGLKKGALLIIASRPGMGKSSLALNIAQKASMIYGTTTAIFTLEMSKEEVANRFLSAQLSIDSKKLAAGKLTPAEWEKLSRDFSDIWPTPIFIDDRSGISALEMLAKCRQLKLEHGLGLVVIDYLQLMQGDRRSNENRQQEISDISRQLKIMARELDCPVIALSQLSRACESRSDKRPMLSDLRDSGAIEQDADVVMFLYRDQYYNEDPTPADTQDAELIVAKNRHGETRTIHLGWRPEFTLYYESPKPGLSEPPPF